MSKKVTIVYCGMGNIKSVSRAFEYFGFETVITDAPQKIKQADYLVLPGVGAFKSGMDHLKNRDLINPVKEYLNCSRPFLGICLGMQMLLSRSTEFGNSEGFGHIKGEVRRIPGVSLEDGLPHKIPNIGWSPILKKEVDGTDTWKGTILDEVRPETNFYFIHSYYGKTEIEGESLGHSFYGGHKIAAVIGRDNVYGCQFHPEKSGKAGLRVIKNFMNL